MNSSLELRSEKVTDRMNKLLKKSASLIELRKEEAKEAEKKYPLTVGGPCLNVMKVGYPHIVIVIFVVTSSEKITAGQ